MFRFTKLSTIPPTKNSAPGWGIAASALPPSSRSPLRDAPACSSGSPAYPLPAPTLVFVVESVLAPYGGQKRASLSRSHRRLRTSRAHAALRVEVPTQVRRAAQSSANDLRLSAWLQLASKARTNLDGSQPNAMPHPGALPGTRPFERISHQTTEESARACGVSLSSQLPSLR